MLWRLRNSFGNLVYKLFHAKYTDISNIGSAVTFTFDDFPETALFKGGKLLKKYNATGTYYLAPGLFGEKSNIGKIISEKDIDLCLEEGHEIGHHTFSHLNCANASQQELIEDIIKANNSIKGVETKNFAFPFGYTTRRARKITGRYFESCRGVQGGVNADVCDVLDLKANAIYSNRNNLAQLEKMITDLKQYGGWPIFYTHDVSSSPSDFGCTEEDLEHLIRITLKNDIPIINVKEAMAKI